MKENTEKICETDKSKGNLNEKKGIKQLSERFQNYPKSNYFKGIFFQKWQKKYQIQKTTQ